MRTASNSQLTLLRKLNRKRYRQQEQLFFLEGERAVQQVIENGLVEVKKLFFDRDEALWERKPWATLTGADGGKHDSYTIEKNTFRDIADTENPQGILALCSIPQQLSLDDFLGGDQSKGEIVVAADRIQDPGNLGAIFRTCSWFGVQAFLAGKGTVDLFHPKVVRSTAGATGTIPWRNADLTTELQVFKDHEWQVLILDTDAGAEDLRVVKPPSKTVIVVGNEANGVDPELKNVGGRLISINPTDRSPGVESLNASIALSIALFELSR